MHDLTGIDRELIALTAVCELIDSIVNYSMFAETWEPTWPHILFRTAEHAALFNIRLSDFLSAPQPSKATDKLMPFGLPPSKPQVCGSDGTFLFYLKKISRGPTIATYSEALENAVLTFANWLDEEAVIENAWFPSIQAEVTLKTPRHEVLKICGNIEKHNFTRLASDAQKIKQIMESHGVTLQDGEEYLILEEFQSWYHDHAFLYQSSHISEQLNTLRWEIHEYIKRAPINTLEFCENPFVKGQRYQLEKLARKAPPVPRFEVDRTFKSSNF
ncbi:hypothetical protein [Leisingera sp. S232]|uniref:hypothetical protein n=1 Tax=Leisingera sp. S232 TaxID=3415132 RepID=UPI003C7D2EB3